MTTANIRLGTFAGYQALELLLRYSPASLDAIETEAWKKWVPIILRHRFEGRREADFQARLVKESYGHVPAEFIRMRLRYHLEEAETLARASTWIPPTPDEFLELAKDPQKRTVSNGNELLHVVVESLRRFEAVLHGELTPVRNLWNRHWRKMVS